MTLNNLTGSFFFICVFFIGRSGAYANGNSIQDLEKLNAGFQASIAANDTAKSRYFLIQS